MFARMFGLKPADPEVILLETHRGVVDALNEEAIRLRADASNARAARDAAERRLRSEKNRAIESGRLASELLTERDAARDRLRQIAAMETVGSAPAAKRMAATARAGLPEFADGEREAA